MVSETFDNCTAILTSTSPDFSGKRLSLSQPTETARTGQEPSGSRDVSVHRLTRLAPPQLAEFRPSTTLMSSRLTGNDFQWNMRPPLHFVDPNLGDNLRQQESGCDSDADLAENKDGRTIGSILDDDVALDVFTFPPSQNKYATALAPDAALVDDGTGAENDPVYQSFSFKARASHQEPLFVSNDDARILGELKSFAEKNEIYLAPEWLDDEVLVR